MYSIMHSLGVDVSGDKLDICLMSKKGQERAKIKATRKFANTPSGINALRSWVQRKHKADHELRVVMEATGVYYEKLAYMMHEAGARVSVVLPNRVKAYMQCLNLKSKTDRLEAKAIARMGLEQELERWQPPCRHMYRLKTLSRERVRLQEEKTVAANQLHAEQARHFPHRKTLTRLRQRIRFLEMQIKQVEKDLRREVARDEALQKRLDKVCTIKGVAFITAASIIAETNGFERFTSRSQLTSWAGYDVVERQSGSTVRGKTRISKKGNRYVRRAMFCPASTALRYPGQFKDLYERVRDRSAIKMKGHVAVQRKLLLLMYTLYKNNETYDPAKAEGRKEKNRQDASPAYTG